MASNDALVHSVEWRCIPCRRIPWDFSGWHPSGQRSIEIQHHASLAALEESASLGCFVCRNLRASIIHNNPAKDRSQPGPCSLRFVSGSMAPTYFFYAGKNTTTLEIRRGTAQEAPGHLSTTIKRLAPATLVDDLHSLIHHQVSSWMGDCVNGRGPHKDCGKPKFEDDDEFFLPTRLIDVGDGESRPARLVLTQDELPRSPKPTYLALSYCWGQGNEPAKTTRANVEERKRGIDISTLPRTIRDAIKLTRLMGARYLWVDATCIIQPHGSDRYLDDWNLEAPRMASYYSNAHCLISALAASDSNQGIFTERPAQIYPLKSCLLAFDGRKNEYLRLAVSRPNFRYEFPPQPLLSRGWCLQERLLSRRAVHWSENCLIWQCNGLPEASEIDPEGSIVELTPIIPPIEHQIFNESAEYALGSGWARVAHVYRSMSFTYMTDRLIAIQGLASRLAALHGDEYFAGVFRSQISDGLRWVPDIDDEDRQVLPYFPTWSWASQMSRGPVSFEVSAKSLVQFSRVDVFPPNRGTVDLDDPSKRALRLEAPLQVIDMGQASQVKFPPTIFSYNRVQDVSLWGMNIQVRLEFDTVQLVPEPLGRLNVLLLSQSDSSSLPTTRISVDGLIIRPKGQFYERIGYAKLTTLMGTQLPLERLLEWEEDVEKRKKEVALI